MPVDGGPGSVLRGGEFYSPVQARLRTDDVLLSELRQPCSRRVPRHEHELAYVTVVLQLGAISGLDAEFEAADKAAADKVAPRWFGRVKERLHEGFREPLRMGDLAREAGVHPVHLARVFRKMEQRTPGEYQQRLQVRAACELLRDREWPLAAIAAECGFADQSHFTRVFRRMAGTTPARFRRAVALRASAA